MDKNVELSLSPPPQKKPRKRHTIDAMARSRIFLTQFRFFFLLSERPIKNCSILYLCWLYRTIWCLKLFFHCFSLKYMLNVFSLGVFSPRRNFKLYFVLSYTATRTLRHWFFFMLNLFLYIETSFSVKTHFFNFLAIDCHNFIYILETRKTKSGISKG